jgi:hypothetical protein
MYILAGTTLVIGALLAIQTGGSQFLPAVTVAVVLAAIGLLMDGNDRRG